MGIYILIAFLLLAIELFYFKLADRFNIVDKPNQRSSHSMVVLRGGGIIFVLGAWLWSLFFGFRYPWFLLGLSLIAGVSFIDDLKSLPDSFRLFVQFVATILAFYQLDILDWELWWVILLALIVYVGITNVINFMDGINGITAGYSVAVLVPLYILNISDSFIYSSFILVTILSVLIFSIFNFRPKGKAKCFAGDVGSIGIAFILLFILGRLIIKTQDITYLVLLSVYGVDACFTMFHRIMLHENLGEAHRKHAYQIMVNELGIGHVKVASLYMLVQLAVSFVYIWVIPSTFTAHWIYLLCIILLLGSGYILFMKKFYPLHEAYLKSLKTK